MMMNFQLDNDRILRMRQRELLGSVTMEILGPVRDVYGTRPVLQKKKVPNETFKAFLMQLMDEDKGEGE